ncbi:DUF6364 family protein [Arachidicoccus sp.]|uniref:DUF6364 family protein n=1 Tax=Arachidicoccus sp. TaxID=1872624 RepID=UPI003D22F836
MNLLYWQIVRFYNYFGLAIYTSKDLCNKQKFLLVMRIYYRYAYICGMKTRLNITVEQHLLEKVKSYAINQQVSISSLIEDYFEPDSNIVADSYNKDNFYEDQKAKYGF